MWRVIGVEIRLHSLYKFTKRHIFLFLARYVRDVVKRSIGAIQKYLTRGLRDASADQREILHAGQY